jgi:hypothetical protein
MRRFFTVLLGLFLSISLFAQGDVTKFLGIPVDGYKSEMRRKLEAKGFVWNSLLECLEGEFNGTDVQVHIVTNNNKVYRIMVQDAVYRSEYQIKLRFNKLCSQFGNNSKYTSLNDDQAIADDEDISYEMSVHEKRYEANFFQVPENIDTVALQAQLLEKVQSIIPAYKLENPTEEVQQQVVMIGLEAAYELLAKKSVWFMIDERNGQYGILMYYDNKQNEANGEDL